MAKKTMHTLVIGDQEYEVTDAAARAAIGAPAVAATVSAMTDTDKIYVYTGSESGYTYGNWYYYDSDSSAWTSGGVYNAVAVDTTLSVSGAAADAASVRDAIDSEINGTTLLISETVTANASKTYVLETPILKGMPVKIVNTSPTKTLNIIDKNGTIQNLSSSFLKDEVLNIVAPFDIYAIKCYNTSTTMSLQIDYGYNASGNDNAIKDSSLIRYAYSADDWEIGSISSSDGTNLTSTNIIRTKSAIYIPSGTTIVLPNQRRFKTFKYSKNIAQANTFTATSNWQYETFTITESGWYRFIYANYPQATASLNLYREVLIAYGALTDYFSVTPNYTIKNYMMMGFSKTEVEITQLGAINNHQSFCIYNDKYYVTDGSNMYVYDSDFTLESTTQLTLGHANACQLGVANPSYAYVSGWNDQKVYVVDLDTLTIIDTITLPTTGYTTVAVDDVNELMYIFQTDTTSTETYYNFIIYNYNTQNVISTKKINVAFGAAQGCDFVNGLIIIANGQGSATLPNGFRVFNTNGDMVGYYVLNEFESLEPEGIFYDKSNNDLYVSIDYPIYIYKVAQKF